MRFVEQLLVQVCLLFAATTWLSCEATVLRSPLQTTFVPAKSLRAAGRFAFNETTALFEFPGVEFSLTLGCTSANASVLLDFEIEVPKLSPGPIAVNEKFTVSVDGERSTTFVVNDSLTTYSWKHSFKGDGGRTERKYTLRKITERMAIPLEFVDPVLAEGQMATAFHGVHVTSQNCKVVQSPPASPRRLDFLGDSITCGFGNLVDSVLDQLECVTPAGWRSFEDFEQSQGHLAAQRFGAELNTACISILGVTRNGDSITRTSKYNATHYLHRAVPTLGAYEWDYARHVPDVAVVNLGTNDYDLSRFIFEAPSLSDFGGNYTIFLRDLVRRYAGLPALVLACGPMVTLHCKTVEKVSQDLATEFPAVKVRFVNLTLPSAEKNGCLRHPNVQGHKAMFEQLEPVLSDLTGWK